MYVMRGDVFKVILIVSLLSLSVLLLPKITSLTGHAVADCVDTDSDGFLDTACTEENYECGNTRAIVELKKNQKNPDIYANFITYKSKLDGVWLIYKIDITTKEIILVSSNITTDSINPQIYEERIVWQKNVGTTGDEVWKTIIKEGDNDEQIIGGDTETVNPAISKDILVWTQLNEEGDYDISFEVRVDYIEDDDEDLDGKEYIKVNVEIRDGEAEDISFEEI